MPEPYDEMTTDLYGGVTADIYADFTADLDTLERVLTQLREDNARLIEQLARKDSVIAAQTATITELQQIVLKERAA